MTPEAYVSDPNNSALVRDIGAAYDAAEKELFGKSDNPPRVLYHYTDASGFLGIVGERQIRATHHAFLNDPLETEFANTAFIAFAGNYGDLGGALAVQMVNRFAFETWWSDELRADLYVACFSRNRDLLSQWRAYSSSGSGFSLGIDVQTIPERVRSSGIAQAFLRRTIYDQNEQREILRLFFEPAMSAAQAAIKSGLDEQRVLNELWRQANILAIHCSCCFKQEGYSEEDEWRLVLIKANGRMPQRNVSRVSFRERRGQLIPYISAPLDVHGALREVVVGPASTGSHVRAATEMFLQSQQLSHVQVSKSKTALRG